MGIADFLHRIPVPSQLGDLAYEPWDTKLARKAKPYFILQLCAYADMLESVQGHRPERFGFILGDNSTADFQTKDFWNYYQRLKRSFERFQEQWTADERPDPALDRTHGRWSATAERILEQVDDLSLVAGITRSQIIRLRDAGIDTVAKLASSAVVDVPRMTRATFDKLQQQAEMQVASRNAGTIIWKHRAPDPDRARRGLAMLPSPSPNDIYFDIEGFPWATDGLEYLLGVVTTDGGAPVFRAWWAHDDAQEKLAFEQFIDFTFTRWKSDPTLHVYHYAAYERTALCRLMSKYGTREFEVDELLRHSVLVDLYPVVLQGMVIGTPSYSLKYVEKLYMPPRSGDVVSAGGSVVEYQKWLDAGEPEDPSLSPILEGIRAYNEFDCVATVGLRDWLLARQTEAGISYIAPEKTAAPETPTVPQPAEILASAMLAAAELEPNAEKQRITRLLAWLLEFHRRAEKPWWWKHFEQLDAEESELYDDTECLAGLVRTETPSRVIKKSTGHEYRFDPDQETKLDEGDTCVIPGTDGLKCEIVRYVDRDAGLIELKVGPGKTLPDRLSLIPASPMPSKPLRESIFRFVSAWTNDENTHPALRDLLERNPPRLTHNGKGTTLDIDEISDLRPQAIDVVRRLDHSTLCIQGPPGTGKTTIAAEMILALVADGKKVGIVSNSHQVVLNLMDCIARRGAELNQNPRVVKVTGPADHPMIENGRFAHIESKEAAASIEEGPLVIGGTAWAFSREELTNKLDYLFIEEAGQFCLANAVAVAPSTANLILLGDQMQLSQPTQGSHPGESGLSSLEYLLQDHATVPPDRGIFLGVSYRMHPDVCRFISEAYYEGRLHSAPQTASNRIVGGASTSVKAETGVRFVPIDHDGCTQDSDEEVCAIEKLVAELMTCRVTVKGAPERAMTLRDILVVAPFNMQVRALKHRLGKEARVGSVDKFQGQEAPVVIVSMCASTLDDAPRGAKFLLSTNRLNVAISRAQALAIVVASRQLGDIRVRSIEEMRLVSGWCRIEECAV
jgi:RecB family nuclease, putative, TM0106 family